MHNNPDTKLERALNEAESDLGLERIPEPVDQQRTFISAELN